MTKVTVSEAYETLSSYQRHQMQVLASIKTEQSAALRQYEAVVTSLDTLLHDTFPTVEDLPLTSIKEDSRLKNEQGIERNSVSILNRLIQNDKTNRRDFNHLVSQHGSIENLRNQKEQIVIGIKFKKHTLSSERSEHESLTSRQRYFVNRMRVLTSYTLATEIETSSAWAEKHRKFNLWKQLTDKNWRTARIAFCAFHGPVDSNIDKNKDQLRDLDKKIKQKAKTISQLTEDVEQLDSDLSDVSVDLATLEKLEKDYKSPAKIDEEIYDNFANFICKNLPVEQANLLMEATLKFKNLRIVLDNLQKLHKSAENTLEKLEKPISDLEAAKNRKPSHMLDIDLDNINKNLDKFNSSVKTALARSSSTRQTANDFSTSNATNYYATDSYQDDPFAFWRTMFLMQMMNDASANPDCHIDPQATQNPNIDTIDAAGTMPVMSSDLGDLGTNQMTQMPSLTIEMPVIAVEVPAISVPTIDMSGLGGSGSGYSSGTDFGGGYSGGSDVSSVSVSCDTGGGCMISATMNIPAVDSGVRKLHRHHGRARAFTI